MFNRLQLAPKFTLILLLVFILGSAFGGLILSTSLQRGVEDKVAAQSVMLMESMQAVRRYTDQEVRPLLEDLQSPGVFWPEAIPAYSTRRVFELLHEAGNSEGNKFEYSYKEAVLNPTNPNDLADEFEEALVEDFLANPEMPQKTGYRQLPDRGTVFYNALPIVIRDPSCLTCHSVPEAAPPAMLAQYGRENGFGWQLNRVLGTQIVYVPAEDVFRAARTAFSSVMGVFFVMFAIALFCLNTLLKPLVVQPVQSLAKLSAKLAADDIQSAADLDSAETRKLAQVTQRQDELGQLGRVFERMVNEVVARQRRLQQQIRDLRIEIDQKRKDKEVQEIVETDYFQSLQEKAQEFRNRKPSEESQG